MRVLKRNGKTYRLPSLLNQFQELLYVHLIDWKRANITESCGTSRGISYDAILPDNLTDKRPLIYPDIKPAMEEHLQRFPFRIHKYFNHMASSQAANINLFLPILRHSRASAILGALKPDFKRLATDYLDHGYRIEFWDEPCGCLGDKTDVAGTDSDLAIAYYNHDSVLCLWLIEHKLSEKEFTQCGGFKSKGRQGRHNCGRSFKELAENPSTCYYHDAKSFNYWKITAKNAEFFVNHTEGTSCPFRGGMNQLWRNQLLALAIEQDERQPYQKTTFSVVRHPRNHALDRTIGDFEHLIAGNQRFTTFTSADVIAAAAAHADDSLRTWISWYRSLYDI